MVVRDVLCSLCFLFVFAVMGCDQPQGILEQGADGEGDPRAASKEEDASAREYLSEKDAVAEAKAWLAATDEKHVLWKGDRKAISKLVDDLYASGSPKVHAVGIAKEDGVEIVATFVAEMPTDAAKRKQVLEAHNAFWKKYLDDDEESEDFLQKEYGQQYLILNFDL